MRARPAGCAWLWIVVCAVGWTPAVTIQGEPPAHAERLDPAQLELFERHVRPVLVERCGGCHGAAKQFAGLRLDSREGLLRGGDSGPALVPGDVAGSRLIEAVRYTGDIQMPPQARLPAEQVAALERWVAVGAPWPRSSTLTDAATRAETSRRHWAFQPLRVVEPPQPASQEHRLAPIDAFLQATLREQGLEPAPLADPRSLLRRLSLTLTGLPPSAAEVDSFVRSMAGTIEQAEEAYLREINRLLASPAYGEHWGRHWLDVARYSDTKGYVYAREERFFIHAWAYRDWVVRALNDDMPYDRFLLLQLAARQLEPDDPTHWGAMGFLTLGRRFLGVGPNIIDDRIDVVTRGTLGLTVACARCHDHKYDPIPTADYYSLYGVFENQVERSAPIGPARGEGIEAYTAELLKRREALEGAMSARRGEAETRARSRVADYLQAQFELDKYPEGDFTQILTPQDLLPRVVWEWNAHLRREARRSESPWFLWHALADVPAESFAETARERWPEIVKHPGFHHFPLLAELFASPPASRRAWIDMHAKWLARIDLAWQSLVRVSEAVGGARPSQFPDPRWERVRRVLYGPDSPCSVPAAPIVAIESYFDTDNCQKLWKLQGEVDRHVLRGSAVEPWAVYLDDRTPRDNPRIFKRGNQAMPGDEVPRRFLEILSGSGRKPFEHGSGALELARAIVDPANPLTARVIVNRIWQRHFGQGLVRTPSDFGLRAEPPSHPELLDWLAARFMAQGWSLKTLHREIVLSHAFRQLSTLPAESPSLVQDPENRWLGRYQAHRLSFEEWRDAALAASGELDRSVGGKPRELFSGGMQRRTLYGLVDRQFLPPVFRVFDFANPDLHIPQRAETTVPQQALFGLNHPFLAERARRLLEQPEVADAADPAARLQAVYRRLLQRDPTSAEQEVVFEFLQGAEGDEAQLNPWQRCVQVLLLSNEVAFVD